SMQQAARDAKLEKGQEDARESERKALERATQERILANEEAEKIAKEKAKSELRTKRLRDETEAHATREREDPPAIGTIIKSVRDADQLLCDGYRYRRDKSRWRCVNAHCIGRAGVTQLGFYQLASSHTHAPNPEDVAKARYNHEIRQRAKQSHDPPRNIISDARMNVSAEAAASIPQYTTTQRAIERIRKENDVARPTPTTFADIVLPDELKVNSRGQKFLLYDNQDVDRRVLISASEYALDRLDQSSSWHVDGTFKVAPKLFQQLYTIHGYIRGKTVPLVFCILPNKTQATYEEVFTEINTHLENLPHHINLDFEKAAENA
ncbi:unnamed protein product, partial [Didymodactylos carnosus]